MVLSPLKRYIALYVTPQGEAVCRRLKKKFNAALTCASVGRGTLKKTFSGAMRYDGVIAVMATGIVVRGIAPHLTDKMTDPAVVVIDEKAQFVISLLSGHAGGANELARELASLLNALPVITTATDVNDIPAPDVYARTQGYVIADRKGYTRLAMAMIRGETVGVFVEKGEPVTFFKHPAFTLFKTQASFKRFDGPKLAVTWRRLSGDGKTVCFIPRRLVAGMGFHRGMTEESLYSFVADAMAGKGFFVEAIKTVATIDRRKGQEGFNAFCRKISARPVFFSAGELATVGGVAQSETVNKYHGVGNVCEACALLAGGNGTVVVPKIKGGTATLCVIRERYTSSAAAR